MEIDKPTGTGSLSADGGPERADGAFAETRHVRYVFLDVVGFSSGRTVEAQTDIIAVLNKIVRQAALATRPPGFEVLFLPTGDGVCVALLDAREAYDAHVAIALLVQGAVHAYNTACADEGRRFEVRVGVNENTDNLVKDINGKTNVAGAGVNDARRVMEFADGGQILLSQAVQNVLAQRERYRAFLKPYRAVTKHKEPIVVFQLTVDAPGISRGAPRAFAPTPREVPKLSLYQAYYLAHAIQLEPELLKMKQDGDIWYAITVLLHMLALDAEGRATFQVGDSRITRVETPTGAPLQQRVAPYRRSDFWLCALFSEMIRERLQTEIACFAGITGAFITGAAKERLRLEHPAIWSELAAGGKRSS